MPVDESKCKGDGVEFEQCLTRSALEYYLNEVRKLKQRLKSSGERMDILQQECTLIEHELKAFSTRNMNCVSAQNSN
jgi:hypothetical protein